MSDTRSLLNRIAEFRQRIEAIPRLKVEANPPAPAVAKEALKKEPIEAGLHQQATIEYSLRQLAATKSEVVPGHTLCHRARRVLIEAGSVIQRLKAFAEDPVINAVDSDESPELNLVPGHFREVSSMAESIVRSVQQFPEAIAEQMRLCDGVECLLDSTLRRLHVLAGLIEQRRAEVIEIDALSRYLTALVQSKGEIDAFPLEELAKSLLAQEPIRLLKYYRVGPGATQLYVGGPVYPVPSRWVAVHSLNVAKVLIRAIRHHSYWQTQALEVVKAALLHDVGMMSVPEAILVHPGRLTLEDGRTIEQHAALGAQLIRLRLPQYEHLAEAIEQHHERANGTGYPRAYGQTQLSALGQLLGAADVYAAMVSERPYRPGHDPRAALTDLMMMVENNLFAREIGEVFLHLGLYPPGTVVELTDGSVALTLHQRDLLGDVERSTRPLMAILCDASGRSLPAPRVIDLAETSNGSIVRALSPLERARAIGRAYPEYV